MFPVVTVLNFSRKTLLLSYPFLQPVFTGQTIDQQAITANPSMEGSRSRLTCPYASTSHLILNDNGKDVSPSLLALMTSLIPQPVAAGAGIESPQGVGRRHPSLADAERAPAGDSHAVIVYPGLENNDATKCSRPCGKGPMRKRAMVSRLRQMGAKRANWCRMMRSISASAGEGSRQWMAIVAWQTDRKFNRMMANKAQLI